MGLNQRPSSQISSYNIPRRKQALLEIRRLIVDEGLSHNEIQLRLNLSPSTYFRYLDTLFKAEQEAIEGNNYTYQRLLNETLILNQRYLRRARKLTAIGDDEKINPAQRIEAHKFAAQLERAVHDMSYMGPSYLRVQGLLPDPKDSYPSLTMSQIDTDDIEKKDPWEKDRIKTAGEYRQKLQKQQLEQKQPQPQQQQQEESDELDYHEEEEG
ncbi:MAG: hypothetical protein M3299_00855 [Thermoproteota archaeon]|nr:hypothetical protein [Thermoproteota archaeon]